MTALVTKRVEELQTFAELEDDDRLVLGRGEGPAGTATVEALRAYMAATGVGGEAAELAIDASETAQAAAVTASNQRAIVAALVAGAAMVTGMDAQRRATWADAQAAPVAETAQRLLIDNREVPDFSATAARASSFTVRRMTWTAIVLLDFPEEAWFRHATDRLRPDLVEDEVEGGYWVIERDTRGVSVGWFPGGDGQAGTDAVAAFEAATKTALAWGGIPVVYGEAGATYYFETTPDTWHLRGTDFLASKLVVNPEIEGKWCLAFGGHALTGATCSFRFGEVTDGSNEFLGAPERPILAFVGVKNSWIEVGNCNAVGLIADTTLGAAFGSTAYNHVQLNGSIGRIIVRDYGVYAWVNGNKFFGGRPLRWTMKGWGYPHNHNIGLSNQFEGEQCDIDWDNIYSCHLYDVRFEGVNGVPGSPPIPPSPGIKLSATTYGCFIEWSWVGTGTVQSYFQDVVPIDDQGKGNTIVSTAAYKLRETMLFDLSARSRLLATASECVGLSDRVALDQSYAERFGLPDWPEPPVPGFDTVHVNAFTFPVGTMTDSVPVRPGTVIRPVGSWKGPRMRLHVQVLDAQDRPLTSEGLGGPFISMIDGTFLSATGRYVHSGDYFDGDLTPIVVLREEVKRVRVWFYCNVGGPVTRLACGIWTRPLRDEDTAAWALDAPRAPSLDGPPTKGFVPAGYVVRNRATGLDLRNAKDRITHATAVLAEGGTALQVASIEGFADGDLIGVQLKDVTQTIADVDYTVNGGVHWTTVDGEPADGVITLAAGIPDDREVEIGAKVGANLWVAETAPAVSLPQAAAHPDCEAVDVAGVVAWLNDFKSKFETSTPPLMGV